MKLLLVNLVAVTHPSGHTQYLDAIEKSKFGLIPSENIANFQLNYILNLDVRLNGLHRKAQSEFGLINSRL